jgi:shikimate dehydrogenase
MATVPASSKKTLKLGVLGYPLTHSKSPQIQKAGLDFLGIDGEYDKYEINPEEFSTAIPELLSSVDGLNITIPYKEKIIKYLNKTDKLVERIGAANTLVIKEGLIEGFNTDYFGFCESLRDFNLEGTKASIIGGGGASKAIIIALEDLGVTDIDILVRNVNKTEDGLPRSRKSKINVQFCHSELSLSDSHLLINCTPVGQGRLSDNMPIEIEQLQSLNKKALVYDLIYSQTKLLQEAKKLKLKTMDGSQMLILQGVKSLSLWTKKEISNALIKAMTKVFG